MDLRFLSAGLCLVSAFAPSPSAQTIRLSAPFERPSLGDVRTLHASADGSWVVFDLDASIDGSYELFGAPTDGSAPAIALSGSFGPGRGVQLGHGLAADGAHALYRATTDSSLPGLFAVPIDGSAPPLALSNPDDNVTGFESSLDGELVLYRAQAIGSPRFELFVVPIDRSAAPIVVSGSTWAAGGSVQFDGQKIAPDGTRIVYRADQTTDEVFELYAAPLDGSGAPLRISGSQAPGGDVVAGSWRFSGDGTSVVFLADRTADGVVELFAAPLDGSAPPVRLNGALVGGGDVQSFTLSPSRVVYLADQDTDQVVELYSAPVDGSASASRLSPSLAPGEVCNGFELTLDGARAVFVLLGPAQRRLFVAPVDGSAPATLVFSSGLLGPFHFRLGPDGAHLALLASLNVPGRDELYSLALEAASAPVRLNARLAPGGDVQGLPLFSADGSELVYFADGDVDDVLELYATSSDGLGPVRKLNGALVECGEVAPGAAQVFDAPGGARALFVADAERDEVFELYAAPLDGSAPAAKLDGPITAYPPDAVGLRTTVTRFAQSRDGAQVVYQADQDCDDVFELYALDFAGERTPVELCGTFTPGGDVPDSDGAFALSPDGARVAYIADQEHDEVFQLRSVSVHGDERPVRLDAGLVPDGDVRTGSARLQFTPDGARVLYAADQRADEVVELFAAPSDGRTSGGRVRDPATGALHAPAPLSGPLVAGGDVSSATLTPDGSRVLYLADQLQDEVVELFSAPMSGAGSVVRLNGPLVLGGDVSQFVITPDGSRALYSADQQLDGRTELYSVPVDGSAAALELDTPPHHSTNLIAVTPDGADVLYTSDPDTVFDLFVAPVDGSASPRKLNPPLAAVLLSARLSPDGTRALFVAAQAFPAGYELFVAPLDGSAPALSLTGPLPFGRVIWDFAASPDGLTVVYRADQDTDDLVELYSVPIDASAPAQKLNESLATGAQVQRFEFRPDSSEVVYLASGLLMLVPSAGSSLARRIGRGSVRDDFQFSPDGSWILFRGDPERSQQFELFATFLAPTLRRAAPPAPLH